MKEQRGIIKNLIYISVGLKRYHFYRNWYARFLGIWNRARRDFKCDRICTCIVLIDINRYVDSKKCAVL